MSFLGRALLVLVVLASSGCAAMGSDKIGVSLSAVNYTDEDYDVVGIARADDPEQLEAMERVAAYAGSGTMCCVSLPTQWRPGLKVVVKTRLGIRPRPIRNGRTKRFRCRCMSWMYRAMRSRQRCGCRFWTAASWRRWSAAMIRPMRIGRER